MHYTPVLIPRANPANDHTADVRSNTHPQSDRPFNTHVAIRPIEAHLPGGASALLVLPTWLHAASAWASGNATTPSWAWHGPSYTKGHVA